MLADLFYIAMKKIILSLFFMLLSLPAFSHFMWIETQEIGQLKTRHEIRVHFGEYTYGVIEKVGDEAFNKVSKFTLWLVAPDGTKTQLETKPAEMYYVASFLPEQRGTYSVYLNNNEIDVIDYTQYDFGIFKTHYHATAKINVGKKDTGMVVANDEGIVLKKVTAKKDEAKFQVFYKNKPLAENEVTVFVADQWSKKIHTDKEGYITFALPWFNTKYILETTIKEEVPGTYKGESYQFIWHCATYTILN